MKNKNAVLIGMPGAGKSTVGVLLAKTLGMPFVDTDLLIQQQEKKLLQNLMNAEGLENFLAIEEDVILKLDVKKHVIATGGSVVYSERGMRHLKIHGIVFYLKLRYDEIERRLNNIISRGIAMTEEQKLMDLFIQRVPLYEKYADITIDCSDKDIEDIVSEIKDKWKK